MDLFKVILLIILQSNLLLAQKNTIKEVFPQTILKEDFNNLNQLFPTESSSNQFAIIIDTIGKYFIGTETSQYSMILDWENDLNDKQHTRNDFVETLNMKTLHRSIQYISGAVIAWAFDIRK